jgi:hypothetical protein
MNIESFNNLELIPKLLAKIEQMEERQKRLMPPITTKKEVAKFLGKSERTINNYIERGLLRDGYHFHRKNVRILVFIEDAISEFRRELHKGIAYEEVTI